MIKLADKAYAEFLKKSSDLLFERNTTNVSFMIKYQCVYTQNAKKNSKKD